MPSAAEEEAGQNQSDIAIVRTKGAHAIVWTRLYSSAALSLEPRCDGIRCIGSLEKLERLLWWLSHACSNGPIVPQCAFLFPSQGL